MTPSSLTPVHADLAKLCLVAKCFSPALPFLGTRRILFKLLILYIYIFIHPILDTDINMVCKENGQFDAMYLLLYYYYGGCIYSALKKFDRALFFFEVSPVSRRWNELHTRQLTTNPCARSA